MARREAGATGGALVLVALLALAFTLRPAAVEVGPVLQQLRADLGLTGVTAGILTALPTLCFAGFGALAPGVARRLGLHRTILVAMLLVVGGQLARAWSGAWPAFLAFSMVALSGMAAANVLLPSLVKLHFPQRVGLVTAAYSTSMTVGVTLAGMLVVPLADMTGGWRGAFTAVAVVTGAAVLPWLVLALRGDPAADRGSPADAARIGLRRVARTRLGWAMAVFFGFQSAQAYAVFGWLASIYGAAGFGEAASGVYLGIATGVGIPLAFAWPAYAARNPRPARLLLFIVACGVAGYLGLMLTPHRLPWVWAVLVAIGTSTFPMVLALIGMRSATAQGTAALSGFSQSVGYLIAVSGPFLMGVLHDATGGWRWPMLFMVGLLVPMTVAGLYVCRSGLLEDEL